MSFLILCQLLKGVTIAAGGVLPNIHPELLAKKRGAKGKLETPVSPAPEKKPKPVKKTAAKKQRGKKAGGKAKVRQQAQTQIPVNWLEFVLRKFKVGLVHFLKL